MKYFALLLCLTTAFSLFGQYSYEPSREDPYGKLNPDAPRQTADFAPLIGKCMCKSVTRIDQNTWADTVMMVWTFKYIMNGMAIQDETLKEDQAHSGSIRQYNADSARWYVHYYSSPFASSTLPAWEGNLDENGEIVLYRNQKAPNGMEGFSKLVFHDISKDGFNWTGGWVDTAESFNYPTWRIFCKKME